MHAYSSERKGVQNTHTSYYNLFPHPISINITKSKFCGPTIIIVISSSSVQNVMEMIILLKWLKRILQEETVLIIINKNN